MSRLRLYTREKSKRDAEEGAGNQHRACCPGSWPSSSPSHSRLFPRCVSRLRVLQDVPVARRPDAADAGEILEEEPSYVLKGEKGKFLGRFPLGEWGLGSSCERRREASVCWVPALCQALERVSSRLMCINSLQDDRVMPASLMRGGRLGDATCLVPTDSELHCCGVNIGMLRPNTAFLSKLNQKVFPCSFSRNIP